MIIILDWIFEGIANWVASIVTQMLDACSGIFLHALGTDMTAMEEYFPFITAAFEIMQYTAWAILILITIWQLFRVFGGPITEAENPLHLLARSSLFFILIGYAKPIFSIALDIARAPYMALLDMPLGPGYFTFAGIEQGLTNGLTTDVAVISIVGLLLIIIMLIALGWNYFKLLLEVIERYILVGVLCYTSPLAFAMGGAKATNKVFQSWCRMVGSQMLLLIMNVWFLRAFNSSVGQFAANGGALTSGQGNIFLWMFCALAFLKVAQKFDNYLAAVGLNVAQTGSSMGFEMLMAARTIGGFVSGGGRNAGSVFRGGSAAGGVAGAAGTAAAGGFMSGFASKFKPNSFVRDAVVEGGTKMGAGGGLGFVGRAFGGVAARNGAELSGASISSVAARPSAVSGRIAGGIADRSVGNYMPSLAGKSLSGTEITGGHIKTTATTADGKQASVDLFSTAQYDAPASPHSIVTASDGSQWYQMASGAGMGDFYSAPSFTGASSESTMAAETFPSLSEGTTLRTAGEGVIETTHPEDGSSLMYNSAFYDEPAAPHDTITDSSGLSWYAMHPHASMPAFESSDPSVSDSGGYSGSGPAGGISDSGSAVASGTSPASHSGVDSSIGPRSYEQARAEGSASETTTLASEYNQAQFQQFMPGYGQQITSLDLSRKHDGMFEVRHADGTGTQFYDKTMYQGPKGDYQVFEDQKGGQWYAVNGTPTVERRPVFENGKAVYENDSLKTVNVDSIKYKTALTKFDTPQHRDINDRKPPKKKQ